MGVNRYLYISMYKHEHEKLREVTTYYVHTPTCPEPDSDVRGAIHKCGLLVFTPHSVKTLNRSSLLGLGLGIFPAYTGNAKCFLKVALP